MSEAPPPAEDILIDAVRTRARRTRNTGGLLPTVRYLGQIGILGWLIVIPTLLCLSAGRWLDARFATGIFWSGSLLVIGVAIGCWSAMRWVRRS